jgi:DNA helicase-2/ATP-dependent DNA helicase PcrA
MSIKQWSDRQLKIFGTWETTRHNLLIQAVAGSGKSTTILELANRSKGRSLFLAFNKSIVNELSEKVITNASITVSTLHSLGCKAIFSSRQGVVVNNNKTSRYIGRYIKEWTDNPKEYGSIHVCVSRLVDFYRLTLCSSASELASVAYEAGLDFLPKHVQYAMTVLADLEIDNEKNLKEIDFTDMIYLPIKLKLRLPRYDNVFVDECQDLNNAQHLLVETLTQRSRVVYVGDRYQSIYGFAGANTQSFNRILQRDNIIELPLTYCYRCPTAIVAQANQVYDIIESPEWMKKGVVRVGKIDDALSGDMIICRNLRPLIGIYFDLLSQRKKVYIKGNDVGQSLISLLNEYRHCATYDELFGELQQKLFHIKNGLIEKGVPKPTKHPSYEGVSQKVGALLRLSEHFSSIDVLRSKINDIFKEKNENESQCIVLSTIHKSKGLEAENVFLVNRSLIGANSNTMQQVEQEKNLLYVALTRSKQSLVYCSY